MEDIDIDDLFSCLDETKCEKKFSNHENLSDTDTKTTREIITKRPHELEEHGDTIKKAKVENEEDSNLFDDLNVGTLSTRTVVHTLETPDGCTHEVVVPSQLKYVPLRATTAEPAKRYKFILDPFQKEAIKCIDSLQSVLVSAHTSAGKTVVAEYAIALSLKNKQRVIYTTPIKALSNQKYKEFSEEFHDVGLITGDVTINPSASCLIMTTEILRNMLYRGSEITREAGWVIFDEIHYMRDKERGVIWEETLILLPDNVRYVFLSATIPNARQFAEWVCRLHSQPCHVVYTEYRPTPLNHFLYPGGDEIHMAVDDKGLYKRGFDNAMDIIRMVPDLGKKKNRGYKPNPSNVLKIVKMIMEKDFAPAIIFSFSKKDCEEYAKKTAKLDFNTKEEKKMVDLIFNNAMDILSEEDRKLPQIENLIPLLRRGIGIHHSGLLPILKEVVEILFGSGLIKALFATETFAMGLNMPAKTVVFTTPRKFDGKDFRYITSGEYIQMSGRAGRRGLDDMGIVILMLDKKVWPKTIEEILLGKADPLNSAFHLNYNMVLNLLRVEEINVEYIIERSFYQFQNQASIPDLIDKVKAKQKEYNDYTFEDEDSVTQYCDLRSQLEALKRQSRSFTCKPEYLKKFMSFGRLVNVVIGKYDYGWCMVSGIKEKKKNSLNNASSTDEPELVVNVYLHLQEKWKENGDNKPFLRKEITCSSTVDVVPVLPTDIHKISTLRRFRSKDSQDPEQRKAIRSTFWKIDEIYPEGPPLLDPIKDMKICDPDLKICLDKISEFEKRLSSHPIHSDERRSTLLKAYEDKQELYKQLTQAKLELKEAKGILQMDELKKRKNVLRKLGYCNSGDVIELKGRVACELSSTDQLLLTELIFNGVFNDLTAEQSAALLSCFVCDENPGQASNIGEELNGVLRKLQEFARRIAEVSVDANMDLDKNVYVNKFKSTLMDAVLAWSRGATFLDICKMTKVLEGSIIRSMRRLEEVLRQLCQAAKNIGNVELENKFAEAIKLLKRDIVFAASLYM